MSLVKQSVDLWKNIQNKCEFRALKSAQRLQFCIFRKSPAEISWQASLIHLASYWELLSLHVVLIAVLSLPLPVKVNNCNSGYSCSSPMWTPFMCRQGAVLKTGRWRQEEVWEGQLIRKILFLIRAINQCHNYQCHQLVCNTFLLHPGTDQRPLRDCECMCAYVCVRVCVSHTPNYSTWLDICKLDQN